MTDYFSISGLEEPNRWPGTKYFMTPPFPPSLASLGAIYCIPSDRKWKRATMRRQADLYGCLMILAAASAPAAQGCRFDQNEMFIYPRKGNYNSFPRNRRHNGGYQFVICKGSFFFGAQNKNVPRSGPHIFIFTPKKKEPLQMTY